MKKLVYLYILVLAVMILASCSKGANKASKDESSSQQAESEAFENINENIEKEKIEEDDEAGIKISIGETGENLSLPDDFPKDVIPLPEDANIINVNTSSDNKGIGVIFKTGKRFDEAVTYCRDIMKDGTILVEDKKDDSYFLMGSKDKYSIMMSISKYNGEEISILFSVTPQ